MAKLARPVLSQFEAFLIEEGISAERSAEVCQGAFESFANVVNDFTFDRNCPYLRNAITVLQNTPASDVSQTQIKTVGREFDFIGRDLARRSFSKALNLKAMEKEPSRLVAAVATVRNEGPFLLEWISHNISIGIEHFFIYTNDNNDGSTSLLNVLAQLNIITIFKNDVSKDVNPQIKAYDHALHFVPEIREYKWIYYVDADEFLVTNKSIENYLEEASSCVGNKLGSISFNWLWMGSSGHIRADRSKLVTRRFSHGRLFSSFVKSFVRPAAVFTMMNVHKPLLGLEYIGVNSALNEIAMEGHDTPFETSGGSIRHYWNKSFEEFLVKQARGKDRDVWERNTELFFEWDVPLTLPQVPFPEDLALGIERIYRLLSSIQSVRAALNLIEERYCNLVSHISGGLDIEQLYDRAAKVNELTRALDRAEEDKFPSSIEQALLMSAK